MVDDEGSMEGVEVEDDVYEEEGEGGGKVELDGDKAEGRNEGGEEEAMS